MRLRRSVGARGVLRARLPLDSHAGGAVALVGARVSSRRQEIQGCDGPCFDVALFHVALAQETTRGTSVRDTGLCVLLGVTRGTVSQNRY